MKAIDIEKSMRTTITSFVARIPPEEKPRIAGYMFDETLRGYFYYYRDWPIPQIRDPIRPRKIIAGLDSEFDSVITRTKHFPPPDRINLPYQVVAESHPSNTNRKKKTSWIKILRKKK